ncbi:hypothetical protein C4K38_4078 [Pseudomonas chlororaphis subsp. piscium]|nr:hypothetical protein C4K38_4078 [Pseudomonas chlororaphis subsp. piscium]
MSCFYAEKYLDDSRTCLNASKVSALGKTRRIPGTKKP